ncbi:MAG: membrane protein insertase YidC [Sulfuritalea sp.]|jgi:YidC/Oxa1 family membrane protein insertase|nr:membrane protein insertase YidC [Polynucleobacter sp.]MCF8187150.1 membrane protein insertase YidC [Sulfuritalea sp.]
MDIKRTVLLVIFSLSLLMLWENWTIYNGGASMFAPEVASTSNNATTNTKSDSSVPQASVSTPVASGADVPAGAVSAQAGEKITITTDLLKAEINSAGGELTRIELLQHKDSANESKNVVLMESGSGRTYVGQSGLIGTSAPNHRSLFTVRPGMRTLENADSVQLILDAEQDGVKLTKTYTFKRGEYEIELSHEVTNGSAAAITPSVYVQLVRDDSKLEGDSSFYSTFTGPAIYTDAEKFRKVTFEDIDKGKQPPAAQTDKGWIAIVQHYFVSAFEPLDKGTVELFTRKIDNKLYAVGAIMKMESIAPGAKAISKGKLYTGPQESANLEKFAPDFDLVKDYGWLTLIAKPIFWLMEQIQKLLGNWGWTIIVLTIMIKLAFFPLSAASYRSMAKMKLVTPKMTAIRERHKGDAQQMNAAMMELYKTEKINPLGGCLPVVVQIPVFIALYWVLLASVEMRHAPWLGWIQDLAAPDPWYILPVIMAASMFVQTKLNPTPPDPIQAKVMMFMPIAFSVMFFFFPSGLVLYWVVNNLLSIAQQWVITQNAEKGK